MILLLAIACADVASTTDTAAQPQPVGDSADSADSAAPAAFVVFNEALAEDKDGGPDWIELYNLGPDPADLAGWALSDGAAPWPIPDGRVLSAGDWLVIACTDAAAPGEADFKLSASGETLTLTDPNGVLRDEIALPALDPGEAYARRVDGAGDWHKVNNPTPGAAND